MDISPLLTWNKADSPNLELAFKMNDCGMASRIRRSIKQGEQSENDITQYDEEAAAINHSREHGKEDAIMNLLCPMGSQRGGLGGPKGALKAPSNICRLYGQKGEISQEPYMADDEDDVLSFEELYESDDETPQSEDRVVYVGDGSLGSSPQCHSICGLSCKRSRLTAKSPLNLNPERMTVYVNENGSALSGLGQAQNDDLSETISDEDDWSEITDVDPYDYEKGEDAGSCSSWSVTESQSFLFVTRKGSSPQLPDNPVTLPHDKQLLLYNFHHRETPGFVISPPDSAAHSSDDEVSACFLPVESSISKEGKRAPSVKEAKGRRQKPWPRDNYYDEDGYGSLSTMRTEWSGEKPAWQCIDLEDFELKTIAAVEWLELE